MSFPPRMAEGQLLIHSTSLLLSRLGRQTSVAPPYASTSLKGSIASHLPPAS